MKQWKNRLDERQEQAALKVEHHGCWLAFWGLLAAIVTQMLLYPSDEGFRTVAGEWIVFLVLGIYLCAGSMRAGVWDRRLQPNTGTNLLVSLIASLCAGIFVFLFVWGRFPSYPIGAATAGGLTAGACFALLFLSLSLLASAYRKKQRDLEAEPEDSDKT